MFCIVWLLFTFHYYCQLVKGQLYPKSVGAAAPPPSPTSPSVSTGLMHNPQHTECSNLTEAK